MDPVTVARIWLLVQPYKRFKSWREKRRGKRMAIDLGTRTSTNTVVGAPVIGVVYVNLVEMLPYPDLVAALTTPEAVVLATAAFAWIVARFSKTPKQPKVL